MTAAGGDARRALIDAAIAMEERGHSPGTAGNLSVRGGAGMWITPSGASPRELSPDDLVSLDLAGPAKAGSADGRVPSSEWPMHAALYRHRASIGAVVHTHSRFATILACVGRGIPALHYMVAAVGGFEVPLAPYATFGTEELSQHVIAAIGDADACLLANHGQVAVGPDLAAAVRTAELVERLAETTWGSLAIGGPRLLSREQMQEAMDRFAAGYGQSQKNRD